MPELPSGRALAKMRPAGVEPTAFGSGVGATLAIGGGFLATAYERHQERKSVRAYCKGLRRSFQKYCGKLGLLSSEVAAKTVRFYYSISSVVEDLDLLQDAGGSLGLQERYGLNTPAGNLAFHERMLQLSRETFDLGTELIQELA